MLSENLDSLKKYYIDTNFNISILEYKKIRVTHKSKNETFLWIMIFYKLDKFYDAYWKIHEKKIKFFSFYLNI